MRERRFESENYHALFHKGKTLRFAIDASKPILPLRYPEIEDVSLGSRCLAACKFCYTSAIKGGEMYPNVVDKINDYYGGLPENYRPFQVACLGGETLIGTPNGLVRIDNLSIGDELFTENGDLNTVAHIYSQVKSTFVMKGNHGFKIKCSEDHLFQTIDGELIKARDCVGKKLSIVNAKKYNPKNPVIDLALFIQPSSRVPDRRGGAGGGCVKDDKVRLMHTLPFVPRFIELSEDLMWLYGLVVAEGSKRGILLHMQETEYAERAAAIYKNIFGLGCNIRRVKNSLVVEFACSKIFKTVFFDAMRIGKGARNKSINYLFNLSDNLIKSAIKGLLDGDGCYRHVVDKRYNTTRVSYGLKTSSDLLAHEFIYLLQKHFGIFTSHHTGINKERLIEGRILKPSTYNSVQINSKRDCVAIFPEETYCSNEYTTKQLNSFQDYILIQEFNQVEDALLYDISLAGGSRLFTIQQGVVTHNCGGEGEPTMHPDFPEVLATYSALNIMPNYTTNGMHMTDKVLAATVKYSGGAAVSCHPHLEKVWRRAVQLLSEAGVQTCVHIILGEQGSTEDFWRIYNSTEGVHTYVVLPYMVAGRAKHIEVKEEWDKFFKTLQNRKVTNLAFGALFYPYFLENREIVSNVGVSVYEPEVLSGYRILNDTYKLLRKSSYDLSPKFDERIVLSSL